VHDRAVNRQVNTHGKVSFALSATGFGLKYKIHAATLFNDAVCS